MALSAFQEYEAFRLACFSAWWQASHAFARGCAEAKCSAEELWPLNGDSAIYAESFAIFGEWEILDLPEAARTHALSLLSEAHRTRLTYGSDGASLVRTFSISC